MKKRMKFLYDGMLLTLVGVAMRAVSLLISAYLSSEIGAEGVGLHGLVTTVYAFAVTFATSGVTLSVTRLVASAIGEGEGDGSILRGAFIYAFIFGAVSTVTLFLLSDLLGRAVILDLRATGALRILSLSLLPISLSGVISGYFVAVRRVTFNASVQVVSQIMRVVLTVTLIGGRSGGGAETAVEALAVGTTVTELVAFLISLAEYLIDRKMHSRGRAEGQSVGKVARVAMPLALSAYVRSFLLSVEHNLIPRRLIDRGNTRKDALSSYGYLSGMAMPIILFPMTPLSSFSGLLVPEFAECEGAADGRRMSLIASEAIEKALGYAVCVAVFIFAFSEELGYVVYDTYEAGRYVAFLSPVIPIMYLDHVCDSMLKGIGEQVYSMWVNIVDSFLSVVLVYLLIPVFDIYGYALVIIIMELFNFSLSILRLARRIPIKPPVKSSLAIPALSSLIAVYLTKILFSVTGRSVGAGILIAELLFAICVFLLIYFLANRLIKQ